MPHTGGPGRAGGRAVYQVANAQHCAVPRISQSMEAGRLLLPLAPRPHHMALLAQQRHVTRAPLGHAFRKYESLLPGFFQQWQGCVQTFGESSLHNHIRQALRQLVETNHIPHAHARSSKGKVRQLRVLGKGHNDVAKLAPWAGEGRGGKEGLHWGRGAGQGRRGGSQPHRCRQVLNEFKKCYAAVGCDQAQRHQWQRDLMLRLQSKGPKVQSESKKALKEEGVRRATAYQYIRALDHQLGLVGLPLVRWQAEKRASAPLKPHQRRRAVPYQAWPFDVPETVKADANRYIVDDEKSGESWWEVPEFADGRRPLLTVIGDQGGSGLPAWTFMAGHLKMRMLMLYDRYHRVNRDWRLALAENNMWCLVLEMQVVLNFVFGPWKSESWWVQLQEGADSYVRHSGPEDLRALSSKRLRFCCMAETVCLNTRLVLHCSKVSCGSVIGVAWCFCVVQLPAVLQMPQRSLRQHSAGDSGEA